MIKRRYRRQLALSLLWALLMVPKPPAYGYQEELQEVADALSKEIQIAGVKRIAVVDFTNLDGQVTKAGRFLADQLSVHFSRASTVFQVIDRAHIQTILAEHKLASSGIIDAQAARKLGGIAGVDAVVTGTIAVLGDIISLTVKVLDIETANMVAAQAAAIRSTTLGPLLEMAPVTGKESEPVKQNLVVSEGGFRFELIGCRVHAGQITCEVLISDLRNSRDLNILGQNTRVIDRAGNPYKAKESYVGGQKTGWNGHIKLAKGISFRVIILFDNVPSSTKELALFELSFFSRGEEPKIIPWYDPPVPTHRSR